ncbi:MAG: hypothetical protein MJZ00_06755 [Paludibacteraceae bacterium]|nr:hypothetical protein [Paludibacteraceae bacterium]
MYEVVSSLSAGVYVLKMNLNGEEMQRVCEEVTDSNAFDFTLDAGIRAMKTIEL